MLEGLGGLRLAYKKGVQSAGRARIALKSSHAMIYLQRTISVLILNY